MSEKNNNLKVEKSNNDLSLDQLKDNCLANLKILSAIKIGQKLGYFQNKFYIDEDSYISSGTRWWNKSSRNETISQLEKFVSNVFKSIDNIYSNEANIKNNYYTDIVGVSKTFKEENSTILLTYNSEINNCIKGLSNLKQTYKDDISTVSSLDIIIEKLNVRVKKIQGLLQIDCNNSSKSNNQNNNDSNKNTEYDNIDDLPSY